MGISDFSFLNAFVAWNLSVDEFQTRGRGGGLRRNRLKNWEFYAVAAEELMNYVDNEEALISTEQSHKTCQQKHIPLCIPKDHQTRNHTCLICLMEEMAINKLKDIKNKKGRMYSRRENIFRFVLVQIV